MPHRTECAVELSKLYVSLGQLDPALAELEGVLRQERAGKVAMTSVLNHWECDVPNLVLDLYSKKAQVSGVTAEEAMYFFLTVRALHIFS